MDDLHTMADILREVVLEDRPEVLNDQETRWRLEDALNAAKPASAPGAFRSSSGRRTSGCAKASTRCSCISSGDLFGTTPGEEFGGEQRGIVTALLA